jgi:ankyrin repeat protein
MTMRDRLASLGCYGRTMTGCFGFVAAVVVVLCLVLPPLFRHQKGNYDLYVAVGEGDAARVRTLLNRGADPNDASKGDPKLHTEAYRGIPFKGWDTPLILAVETGNAEVARLLLDKGADVRGTKRHGGTFGDKRPGPTPLAAAVDGGDPALVRLLLERGADANDTGETQQPVVCEAAEAGRTEIVRLLLAHGANPNATGYKGRSALWLAEKAGHTEAAEALRTAGAR